MFARMSTDVVFKHLGPASACFAIGIRILFSDSKPLGWFAIAVGVVLLAVPAWHGFKNRKNPREADWRDLESRFKLIEDELEGHWSIYDTGLVNWTVWAGSRVPPITHSERSRDRFVVEAEHAGKMLKRAGYVVPGFPSATDIDGFDYWMSALAATVPRESGITGTGYNHLIGRSTSGHMENVVHASMLLCARMGRHCD